MYTMSHAARMVGILVLAAGLVAASASAQQTPIHFVSPAGGTVVHPGQSVTIAVAADSSVEKLALLGQHPLPVSQVVAPGLGVASPFEFRVAIPANIRPGHYRVTAIGTLAGGETVAERLVLDVEKTEEPARIWAEPSSILFSGTGERIPVRVLGAYADNSQQELTKSSQTTYTSADPNVATVSADGLVTSVGAGKTTIQVHATRHDLTVPVTVAAGSSHTEQ